MGGLGNVLFQINYAHNLRSHGFEVTLNHFLLNDNFVTTKLLGWPNHNALTILQELGVLCLFQVDNKISLNLIFGFISKFIKRRFLNTEYFGLISPDSRKLKASHLFGYFHINNPINLDFITLTKRAIEKKLCDPESMFLAKDLDQIGNSWVIHIRGGDYELDPIFAIDMDYYYCATSGKKDFYVVTNDKKYSEIIMTKLKLSFNFVSSRSTLEDFIILTMSTNKILANSTFSWWAAEIGPENSNIIQSEPFFKHLDWLPITTKNRNKLKFKTSAEIF